MSEQSLSDRIGDAIAADTPGLMRRLNDEWNRLHPYPVSTLLVSAEPEPVESLKYDSPTHWPIPLEALAYLNLRQQREDIIRRACAQVALQSVNDVLRRK